MEATDYLRALLASGMTQSAIAEKTSIPQPTISRIARGKVKDVPSRRSRKLEALWELELGQRAGANTSEAALARDVRRMQASAAPVEAKAA